MHPYVWYETKNKQQSIDINTEVYFGSESSATNWLISSGGLSQQKASSIMSKAKFAIKTKSSFYNYVLTHPDPSKARQAVSDFNLQIRPVSLQSIFLQIINQGNGFTIKLGRITSSLTLINMLVMPNSYGGADFIWKALDGNQVESIYNDCRQRIQQLQPHLSHIIN